MRPVSTAWLAAVKGSHSIAVDARVVETYAEGTDPDGTEIPVLDGEVELDGTADIRSTLDLTTDGTRMWPRRGGSLLLAPYGADVFVRRGIRLSGGSIEWVSLGFHRINNVEQDEPPSGPIQIQAVDRMAGIVDGRLLRPVQFPSSTTYGGVVAQLVGDVYPTATIEWDGGDSDLIGRKVVAESDRYGFLNDLIVGRGKIWYWDHRGRLQIKDPPDPTSPVFTVNSGAGGVLVSLSRKLSREGVYNVVVVTGEAGDTTDPVLAIRADINPQSPTYVYGRFGPVPRYFSSPLVTTKPQAQSAATSMLRRQLGLPYTMDLTMVPNVALEPYDPVAVVTPDGHELHVLQRLSIPLVPEAGMDATTREQTRVLIGDV